MSVALRKGRQTFHSRKHAHSHTDSTGTRTPDAVDVPNRPSNHKLTRTRAKSTKHAYINDGRKKEIEKEKNKEGEQRIP